MAVGTGTGGSGTGCWPLIDHSMFCFRCQWIEVAVLSLYVMFSGLLRSIWCSVESPSHFKTHITPTSSVRYSSTTHKVNAKNVERVFKAKYCLSPNKIALKNIGIYSALLDGSFHGSKPSVRKLVQRQFSPVDYHAFVVFETTDGDWWAIDKMRDGVYVSKGEQIDSVLFHFGKDQRSLPVCKLIEDDSKSLLSDVVQRLEFILESDNYDLIEENCQHFSKGIFDKFARLKTWKLKTLTDVTSPLTLLTDSGSPLLKLLWTVSILFELFFLFNESRASESCYHYKIAITFVILTSLLQQYLGDMWDTICVMLFSALVVEGLFCSTLGVFKQRGAYYREMWELSGTPTKLMVPLGYMIVYMLPTLVFLFIPTLFFLHLLSNFLIVHVPSVVSPLQTIITRFLDNHERISDSIILVTGYLLAVVYLISNY